MITSRRSGSGPSLSRHSRFHDLLKLSSLPCVCGCSGRPWITSTPSSIAHASNAVMPFLCGTPHGLPLSHRMVSGSPYSRNAWTNGGLTASNVSFSSGAEMTA